MMKSSGTEAFSLLIKILLKKLNKCLHLLLGSHRYPQILIDTRFCEITHIDVSLSQSLKQLFCRTGWMGHEDIVRLGIRKLKPQSLKFLFCPLPRLLDLCHSLLELFPVCHTGRSQKKGRAVHGIRIERVFHIIQISNQRLASEGISDTHTCHRT